MATPAAIQAALDSANQMNIARINQSVSIDATYDAHYVVGGIGHAGRSKWCQTTKAQTAGQQATAILAVLDAN